MKKYLTPSGYVVCLKVDSVGRYYKAVTNDFDFYAKHLRDLEWKSLEEAQADLDKIAKENKLKDDR